jgi:hypothetical protein
VTRRSLRLLSALAATAALAGCQWFDRRESLSLQSGDAVAWNRAIHTIDPWPPASSDTNIPTSGQRIARAIEIYESGPTPQSANQPSVGVVPMVPIAPGAPAN